MIKWIDSLTQICGRFSSYATIILLISISLDLILRTFFSTSYNALMELQWHFFAFIFLLGGSYNLKMDKHVRVDFFYEAFSEKTKNGINFIFHLILLIPWSMVGIYTCFNYASNSFYIREASANPGGLPAIYPIKYMIVVCFMLIFLQGISEIIKTGRTLQKTWNT